MTYDELVNILDHYLSDEIHGSQTLAQCMADELKARGLYLETDEHTK